MKKTKAGTVCAEIAESQELELVNAFAKAKLKQDEVYIFSVLLCDNEVDRDFERFSEKTLGELSELFVGATGICDHEWRFKNQVARIYRTELVTDPDRKNSLGQSYVYLKGMAYMLRTENNAELIREIEGGIKKETSIGCSVAKSVCSICGEEMGSPACSHVKGAVYGGSRCYAILEGAVDAYEWSFVAVPAQKKAGVIKHYENGLKGFAESEEGSCFKAEYEQLQVKARLGEKYMAQLKKEVLRLCLLCHKEMYPALEKSVEHMEESTLSSMKAALEKKAEELYPAATQLPGKGEITSFADDDYLI